VGLVTIRFFSSLSSPPPFFLLFWSKTNGKISRFMPFSFPSPSQSSPPSSPPSYGIYHFPPPSWGPSEYENEIPFPPLFPRFHRGNGQFRRFLFSPLFNPFLSPLRPNRHRFLRPSPPPLFSGVSPFWAAVSITNTGFSRLFSSSFFFSRFSPLPPLRAAFNLKIRDPAASPPAFFPSLPRQRGRAVTLAENFPLSFLPFPFSLFPRSWA